MTAANDAATAPATSRRARLVALAVLALATVAGLGLLMSVGPTSEAVRNEGEIEELTGPNAAAQWRAIRLATATPAGERWSPPHPARLRANETSTARIGTPTSGRVTSVFVELGEHVSAGDKLLSVSSPAVASLRAERQRAVLDVATAKTSHARIAAMVEARALAGQEEIQARARLREAELTLALTKAQLSALGVAPADSASFTIVAPRGGIIVSKNVLPSQSVTPDDTLVEIADISTLWAVADVFEVDAGPLHPGAAVRLTSPVLPGWSLSSTVQTVAAVVDPRRRTAGVRALVANPDLKLRPNTYVEMSVQESVPPRSVEIPSSALTSDGGEPYVYVQDSSGSFAQRAVQAIRGRGERVLVIAGLNVGDVVVEEGLAILENRAIHEPLQRR